MHDAAAAWLRDRPAKLQCRFDPLGHYRLEPSQRCELVRHGGGLPPNSLDIHEIGEDYILGVWKDEFHVEYVRVYSLDRGG